MITTLASTIAALPFGQIVANSILSLGALSPGVLAVALAELALGVAGVVVVSRLNGDHGGSTAAAATVSHDPNYRKAA